LPWLEHLYRLFLDPYLGKHNLTVDDEFWIFLSFGIFSLLLYFKGVNVWVPAFFLMGAAIVLILRNNSYIRRRIFPTESEKIENFLNNIDTKDLNDILRFIKDYQLDTNQIIKFLQFKPQNYDIYLFIHKYQPIRSELIDYIVTQNLVNFMGEDLFCKYLLSSIDHISKEKYNYIKSQFTNEKVAKTLNLCYPFYLDHDHRVFKFFSNILIRFRNSINYGSFKLGILFLSFLIVMFAVSKDPSLLVMNQPPAGINPSEQILSNILGVIMASFILAIIFLYAIKQIFKLFRGIIYIISPV